MAGRGGEEGREGDDWRGGFSGTLGEVVGGVLLVVVVVVGGKQGDVGGTES